MKRKFSLTKITRYKYHHPLIFNIKILIMLILHIVYEKSTKISNRLIEFIQPNSGRVVLLHRAVLALL